MKTTVMNFPDQETIIRRTVEWLEKAVIGLNLCPFAKAVHVKHQIRYRVSDATTEDKLAQDFLEELDFLCRASQEEIDTTLVIHPNVLQDFFLYNEFLGFAEDLIKRAGLEGVIQVASFHPAYLFAGTGRNDPENYTNRSPYPMLHLLREDSVSRAIDTFPDTDRIVDANIRRLNELGLEGWNRLWHEPRTEQSR